MSVLECLADKGPTARSTLARAGAAITVCDEAVLSRVQQLGGIEAPAQFNQGVFQSPGRLALDFEQIARLPHVGRV